MRSVPILMCASFLLLGYQEHRADFSGTWYMDFAKSKNLPPSFKNVESYSLTVEQTNDSMITSIGLKGSGQNVTFPQTIYTFHGREVYREDTLRGSKRWITSAWTTTGQKLIVTNRVAQTRDRGLHYTQTDVWELRNRNTLEIFITQKFENSDSTNSERRIFHRLAK